MKREEKTFLEASAEAKKAFIELGNEVRKIMEPVFEAMIPVIQWMDEKGLLSKKEKK